MGAHKTKKFFYIARRNTLVAELNPHVEDLKPKSQRQLIFVVVSYRIFLGFGLSAEFGAFRGHGSEGAVWSGIKMRMKAMKAEDEGFSGTP